MIPKALNCDVKHARTIIFAYCVLYKFCRYNFDKRLANLASKNTNNMTNDNDAQPTIEKNKIKKVYWNRHHIVQVH